MSKKPERELVTRARLALHSAVLVDIASSANSPNSAYELAYIETGDVKKAQSCRHLAMIKRDYGRTAFETAVSPVNSKRPRPNGAPDQSQGEKAMPKVVEVKSPKSRREVKLATLPLRGIKYRAAVNGVFARVRSIQEFENDAQNPVEAVYIFPLPDEASVVACKMRIGKRVVEAELKERTEARREYEQAVQAGHHASLLEQERPNIFTMNVGGIEPGEKISVEVDYVQRVLWLAGGGRFTIPLVVAPRFIPGAPAGEVDTVEIDDDLLDDRVPVGLAHDDSSDFTEVPDASRISPRVDRAGVSYAAEISISFSPGFRSKVSSPSHPSLLKEQTFGKDEVTELKTGRVLTDRDFTLVYQSLSNVPEVARHYGHFGDEHFLVATVLPPGVTGPVASDCVLVLDCSGSMAGASIEGLKLVAKKIVRNLRAQGVKHRVGILPFDNQPWTAHPMGVPSEAAETFIDGLHASGGTELGPALRAAEAMLANPSRPKVILVVTDGQTESGLNWSGNGLRLIAVGIGSAINDTHIKDLARGNGGTYESVFPGEDYEAVANRLAGYLSGPVLSQVSVGGGQAVGVSDVFEGRPATIAVRFLARKGKPSFVITGKDPRGRSMNWRIDSEGAKECDFASQIWAREFIRENPKKDVQVGASLKYGVICRHTAYVAISLKAKPGQAPERVEIPVNLPSGWDYDAVFGRSGNLATLAFATVGGSRVGSLQRGFVAEETLIGTLGTTLLRKGIIDDGDGGCFPPKRPGPFGPPLGPFPRPFRPKLPPQLPSVSTPSRFRLDAADPLDRLVAILVAVIRGNRTGAEKAWRELWFNSRAVQTVQSFKPAEKLMVYYFVSRLAKHGFKLPPKLLGSLNFKRNPAWPKDALAWCSLALREDGVATEVVLPDPTSSDYEYLAWKLGVGERPQTGDWALVP